MEPPFLQLNYRRVSSKKAVLSWHCSPLIYHPFAVTTITIRQSKTVVRVERFSGARGVFFLMKEFAAGEEYSVQVHCRAGYGGRFFRNSFWFTPTYGRMELKQLMGRAKRYQSLDGDRFREVIYFYRDKDEAYFQNVINSSYKKTMPVIPKDQNGDPACPVNSTGMGLFFHGRTLASGEMLPWSYFGSQRFYVGVKHLLNNDRNIYFADFYCMNTCHYVLLVVTVPGSRADHDCCRILPKLNLRNNPFLYINSKGDVMMNHAPQVWIEIFYMANVCTKMGEFCSVSMKGRGATPGGIKKRSDCEICTLYQENGQLRPRLQPEHVGKSRKESESSTDSSGYNS